MSNGLYNGTLLGLNNGLNSNEVGICNFIPLQKPKLLLNFTNGSSIDTSGNNTVITDTNMNYSPSYGRFGGGALFNTSMLTFGSAFTTGSTYTISAWIRPVAGMGTYGCLLGSVSGGLFYRGDLRKLTMYISGDRLSSFIVPLNTWSFIGLSSRGTVGNLGVATWYLNGVEANQIAIATINTLGIGNDTSAEKYIGYMDSFRFDTFAWSAFDFKRYYEQSKNRIFNYGE